MPDKHNSRTGTHMIPVQIIPLRSGMVNMYLVKQDGVVLIDTGIPGSEHAVLAALKESGIRPEDLRLIIVTHGHGDHAGSAARLQEITGARVAVHKDDAGMLQTGTQGRLVPTGLTGWIAAFFVGAVNKTAYPPVSPVILITGTMDLAPYGIAGTIIPTPGHTAGSVSVVLANGAVFSGDLLFPQIPSGEPGLPFWADNIPEIYTSVRALLDHNPQTFYPGHGGPFAAALARKLVE